MADVAMTARARARAEITSEIKAAARRQIASVGAGSLSLRAVARELGMVSSNVYRYFPSREDLLTALIIDAYDAVGEAAERAAEPVAGDGVERRWLAIGRAIREWALANPNDYALVYGSPVPGYRAPADTVPPALRVSLVAINTVRDGVNGGEISTYGPMSMPRVVHADLAQLRSAVAPEVPDDVLARALLAWTALFGLISFELFGHLHNVIHDYDAFFDHQMRRAIHGVING